MLLAFFTIQINSRSSNKKLFLYACRSGDRVPNTIYCVEKSVYLYSSSPFLIFVFSPFIPETCLEQFPVI